MRHQRVHIRLFCSVLGGALHLKCASSAQALQLAIYAVVFVG